MIYCLRLVAPLLDLDLGLAGDTRPAAEGHDGVVPGAALQYRDRSVEDSRSLVVFDYRVL